MILNDVHQGIVAHKTRKRVGRGIGSGHGKTCGRGHKGDGSRAGHRDKYAFEGGQKPLSRRVAKRGFNNRQFALRVAEVNLAAIELAFSADTLITPELLSQKGLAKGRFDVVKILGEGDLSKKLHIQAHRFSASAEEKISKSGGVAERIL